MSFSKTMIWQKMELDNIVHTNKFEHLLQWIVTYLEHFQEGDSLHLYTNTVEMHGILDKRTDPSQEHYKKENENISTNWNNVFFSVCLVLWGLFNVNSKHEPLLSIIFSLLPVNKSLFMHVI